MNIYDFDNTIYDGDSCKDIITYSLKKYPIKVLKCLLKAKKLNKEYKEGKIEFEKVKENMLMFLFQIKDLDSYIIGFVNSHMYKIKKWYVMQKNTTDIILSASYELWIKVFCNKLGVKCIATKTDNSGYIIGKNCKKEEKLKRLALTVPNAIVNESYSDSKSDEAILDIAKKAFVVEGNTIIPYVKGYNFKNIK